MRKSIAGILFLAALSPFLLPACNGGGNSPSSPSGGGPPSPTPTPSFTPTSTPTITPTPNCLDATPIATTSINGPDIQGNDSTDFPPMDLEGYGPNGDVYSFTLSSPATLDFSLCPTDDADRDTFIFLRSGHCWNESGELTNDDACDYLSELTGVPLAAGTYYFIVTENGGDGPGPYVLRVTSGNQPSPVCTVTPISTPQAAPPGMQLSCSTAYALGTLGTGESAATGHLDDNVNTDDWYGFTPANNGTVTVTVDCYDNGLGQADFEVFGYGECPGTTPVGSSTTPGTVEQFTFTAAANSAYYLDVFDNFGSGNYRLTVQAP